MPRKPRPPGNTRRKDDMSEESRFDIKIREDRIGRYFRKYLDEMVFAELTDDFMKKSSAGEALRGVPVPLRKKDVGGFAGGEDVSMAVVAENMTWVMGSDPHFAYVEDYVKILKALYGGDMSRIMSREGSEAAEKGDMDSACIHFRAALCADPGSLDGMYGCARACRTMYLAGESEEYIGRFKAEALDWFEILTVVHPDFAQGYYYLGYAYLNMGLYKKTEITWKSFIKLSKEGKDKVEIETRLEQLKEPLQVEEGCNHIMPGRYEEGIALREPFLSSRFKGWWPLHYYLGVACEMTGRRDEAIAEFTETLRLNGSHLETMEELLAIYEAEGDEANVEKFSRKIEMIRLAMEADHSASMEEIRREDERLMREKPGMLEPEVIDAEAEAGRAPVEVGFSDRVKK